MAAFGYSVDASGDWVIVGSVAAMGLVPQSGAAYLYDSGAGWSQVQKLIASDGEDLDLFGHDVAIDGNFAAIGADNAGPSNHGAVYIFERIGQTWVEQQRIDAPDPENSKFGRAVDIDGDLLVVGDWVAGPAADGAAYVYRYDGTTWAFEFETLAPGVQPGSAVGRAVAVDGDFVAVGAPEDFPEDASAFVGSVYIYQRQGPIWVESQITTMTGEPQVFGCAIAIDGNRMVIGARRGAYVFDWDGASWNETAYLRGSDYDPGAYFGSAVGLSGDRIAIGAYRHGAMSGTIYGAVYLFELHDEVWVQSGRYRGADTVPDDQFGSSIVMEGPIVVAGAWRDSDAGLNSGTVFLFAADDTDCNGNGVCDSEDIALGTSLDANGDGIPDECPLYIRADANGDLHINIADAIYGILYLFQGGTLTCIKAFDINDDGAIDTADAISLLTSLFTLAPPPPLPSPDCGFDPTADGITCDTPPCP